MSAFFVTGAGTEIGKTHVACALLRAWRKAGVRCEAFKPVVSGFDPDDAASSDPARLLAALGRPYNPEGIAEMSPWRFRAALAPPLAARAEGAVLALGEIAEACRERIAASAHGALLIEGAGGVMAPLTETETCLDLIEALGLPVLFVAGTYLGAVSHALTGLEALRMRGVSVAALIVSESEASAGLGETQAMIGAMRPDLAIAAASRDGEGAWAASLIELLDGEGRR